MSDQSLSTADLVAVLERFQLRGATVSNVTAVANGQVELAAARIAALTEVLRRQQAWNDTSRLAARLLLADVAAVSAQFRAAANESSATLTQLLDSIRTLLDRSGS